jgi:transglutaminase-like putative cysteine protease
MAQWGRGWWGMSRADGWRLKVTHETRFDYDAPARASYNELRLTPRTELRQTALETKVVTVPAAAQYSYVDYWGTQVVAFNIDRGHEMLTITGTALVDTQQSDLPGDASWEDVGDASETMADYLSHNLYTAPTGELSELAQGLRTDRPLETARQIMDRVHHSLSYVRGVTGVHTSANEAYADGAGVCQDFAHLALAMTKSVGLPSRYVSGYFHPEVDAIIGEEIAGESHAWVEVWTGSWWAYDPTNDCPVGERHVAIGRGRDYSDVPPVKGIYAGNAEHTMQVGVRITRTH